MSLLQPQGPGIPLPTPTLTTQPFWDGCRIGELRYQRCARCASALFDPAVRCRFCGARELEWHTSAGVGEIYSWSAVWRAQTPAFTVPYVAAIVNLDEGYRMVTNIIGCRVDEVAVGLRVQVEFHHVADDVWLPYFRPLALASAEP